MIFQINMFYYMTIIHLSEGEDLSSHKAVR